MTLKIRRHVHERALRASTEGCLNTAKSSQTMACSFPIERLLQLPLFGNDFISFLLSCQDCNLNVKTTV